MLSIVKSPISLLELPIFNTTDCPCLAYFFKSLDNSATNLYPDSLSAKYTALPALVTSPATTATLVTIPSFSETNFPSAPSIFFRFSSFFLSSSVLDASLTSSKALFSIKRLLLLSFTA